MKDALRNWFTNRKMVDAINLCMEMIEKAGLTESEAEYVPACLYQAIKASNQVSAFSPTKIEIMEVNGGYDITPQEFETLLFQ